MTGTVDEKGTVPVSVRAVPIGVARVERMAAGMTLAAMVEAAAIPARRLGSVVARIQGKRVPREWWPFVRPHAGALVEIAVVPRIGGVAGGLQGLAHQNLQNTPITSPSFGPSFLAAVGIDTVIDIFNLDRKKKQRAPVDAGAGSQDRSAGTSINPITPFEQLWRVAGTRRVAPQLIAPPYTDLSGVDQYVYMLFGAAGPHQVEDIEVNGVGVAELGDAVNVEVIPGVGNLAQNALVTASARNTGSVDLSEYSFRGSTTVVVDAGATTAQKLAALSKPHVFSTSSSPDEVWLTLSFPAGLYRSDTGGLASTAIRLRVRLRGGAWRTLPELRLQNTTSQPFRYMIKLKWSGSEPSSSPPGTGKRVYTARAALGVSSGSAILGAFSADAWFGTSTTANAPHVFVYEDRCEIYLDPNDGSNPWPKGRHDVEIQRGGIGDSEFGLATGVTDTRSFDFTTTIRAGNMGGDLGGLGVAKIVLESVQSIEADYPVAATGITQLAVRARNMQVTSVTALMSGLVDHEDWRSREAADQVTDINAGVTQTALGGGAENWVFPNSDQLMRFSGFGALTAGTAVTLRARVKLNDIGSATTFLVDYGDGASVDLVGQLVDDTWVLLETQLTAGASGHIDFPSGNNNGLDIDVDWVEVLQVTSNPAAHWRDCATGALNAEPLDAALIDDVSVDAWASWCTSNGVEINQVWQGGSVEDFLQGCAAAGQARMVRSDLWGIDIDKDRSGDDPVQMFTPRNARGFRARRSLVPKLPHALYVAYADAADEYRTKQRIVYDDGYNADGSGGLTAASRFEAKTYDTKVTAAEVDAFGLLELRRRRLRRTEYTLEVAWESLVTSMGQLAALNHDVVSRTYGAARVVEKVTSGGNVTGLVLDDVLPLSVNNDFFAPADIFAETDVFDLGSSGVIIRLSDLSTITHAVDETGDTDTVTFTTPFTDPGDELGEGCLVGSGPASTETRRVIVDAVEPSRNERALVRLRDEAPGIFS